jgi:hypothetical protein
MTHPLRANQQYKKEPARLRDAGVNSKQNRRGRSVTGNQGEYLVQLSNPSVSFESDETSKPTSRAGLLFHNSRFYCGNPSAYVASDAHCGQADDEWFVFSKFEHSEVKSAQNSGQNCEHGYHLPMDEKCLSNYARSGHSNGCVRSRPAQRWYKSSQWPTGIKREAHCREYLGC